MDLIRYKSVIIARPNYELLKVLAKLSGGSITATIQEMMTYYFENALDEKDLKILIEETDEFRREMNSPWVGYETHRQKTLKDNSLNSYRTNSNAD